MKLTKDQQWIQDARSFIAYAVAEGITNDAILSNLSHDIFGLAKGEVFLPRCDGYAKRQPFTPQHGMSGQSLGVLLPILNGTKQRRKEIEEENKNESERQTAH